MDTGGILLLVTVVLTGFAAVTSVQRVLHVRLRPEVPRLLALMAALVSVGTMAQLFHIFLSTDLSYEIVWSYSSEDMPTVYKLSGSWAGQAGSMVLWTTMVLVFWAVEELRWWRRERLGLVPVEEGDAREDEDRGKRRKRKRSREQRRTLTARIAERKAAPVEGWLTLDVVRSVVMLVTLVLLMATLALDPFAVRASTFPVGGRGLDPALRTPLMAIHPPIVFMSYAMVTIAFGAAIAHVLRRDRSWTDVARPWSRLAWLTLTLGIGIGAMWAYVTLGWGGYWAWDPVETSSLLPWISLTALLHAVVSFDRRGDYTYMAPFLAGMSMFLVLFATFVTRSGVWASVHSYAGAASGSVADRLGEALDGSASLRWTYYGMWAVLVAAVASAVYPFLKARDDSPVLPPRREGEPITKWLVRWRVTMFATVFLLTVSMALVLLMLLTAAGGSVSPEEYEARLAVFTVPLMAFLVICMGVRYLEGRNAVMAAGVALLAGVVLWAVDPGGLEPAVAWFGASVGVFGAVVVLGHGLALGRGGRSGVRRLVRRSGSIILHAGLALVFMAYCLSNVPDHPTSEGTSSLTSEPVDHDDYRIFIEDRAWTQDTGVQERNEFWDTFHGKVRLERDGRTLESGDVRVISNWKFREYGTLGYVKEGAPTSMNGEVVASEMVEGHLLVKFQSLRPPVESEVVDLWAPTTSLTVWPALWEDLDVLEGRLLRIRNESETWEGFLRDVDGPGGNVTLFADGGEVRIPGTEVERVYRKAYVGLELTDVLIHWTPVRDVYVSVVSATPLEDGTFSATITVQEVPAMSFLWAGMVMMSIGLLLRPLEGRGRGGDGTAREDGGPPEEGSGGGGADGEGEGIKTDGDEEGDR